MFHQLFKDIAAHAMELDEPGCFPEMEIKWMGAAGLLQVVLPDKPLDFNRHSLKDLLQLLKNVGAANLSLGRIYEGHINALQLVHVFATAQQKEIWYGAALKNNLFGVWNTEENGGLQIHPLPNGRFQLVGAKLFCSGSTWINCPLITGSLMETDKKGWQMFILPPGKLSDTHLDRQFWDPMGMKASASYKIDFTGIEIGYEDFLGAPDGYYQEPYFNGGAVRFAAVQLGAAGAVLVATQEFLVKNNRTNTDFQRARIAEMAMLAESGNNWLNAAAIKMDGWIISKEENERHAAYAGMVRTAMEGICSRILYLSGVCVGSRGLMKPNVLERLHRDLTFYLRQPAPDTILSGIGQYVFNHKNLASAWE